MNRYKDCHINIDGKLYKITGGDYDSVELFSKRVEFIKKCVKRSKNVSLSNKLKLTKIINYNILANCYINKILYKCKYNQNIEKMINEINNNQ